MISLKLFLKYRKIIKDWQNNHKLSFISGNIIFNTESIISNILSKEEIYYLSKQGLLKIISCEDLGSKWGIIFEPTYDGVKYNLFCYILSIVKNICYSLNNLYKK